MRIRQVVVNAARQQGLDYKAVAEKSGLPRATVHRFFNGKSDMTSERLDAVLKVLGLCVMAKPVVRDILDD